MGLKSKTKASAGARKLKSAPVTYDTVREIALTLPGAEEGISYRRPACKVDGELFARFHQDGESLVVRVDFDEREHLMSADPEKFYITDHYLNYPYMLVRLSAVRRDQLRDLLLQSWRLAAPKRRVAEFHGFHGP